MRAAFFPDTYRKDNPYLNLLAEGLSQVGFNTDPIEVDRPYINWLLKNRSSLDVLHFHWLSPLYARETQFNTFKGLAHFILRLISARILGYRIIWTMHNLLPHEQKYPFIDRMARIIMVKLAHAVIVHCETARIQLQTTFGRKKDVFIIPVGNYPYLSSDKEVPEFPQKSQDQIQFFFFGAIRPYKGLTELIACFRSLAENNIKLLIVGICRDADLAERLKELSSDDERIELKLGWIEDKTLHQYLLQADVVVLPYLQVMTSSTVMLAMAYAKPVIAPRLGCIQDTLDEQSAFLYDPDDPNGLKNAISRSLKEKDRFERMGRQAKIRAMSYSWSEIGKMTASVYQDKNV